MTAAHLHLILNHFPFVCSFLAFLFVFYGLKKKSIEFKQAGLFLIVVAGLLTVFTFLSGESAEEVLEKMPTFSEELVESHEESAEVTIWVMSLTALLAVINLILLFKKSVYAKFTTYLTMIFNFVALIFIVRTGYLGGQISHPELRDDFNHNKGKLYED